jgi:hypothetical protein
VAVRSSYDVEEPLGTRKRSPGRSTSTDQALNKNLADERTAWSIIDQSFLLARTYEEDRPETACTCRRLPVLNPSRPHLSGWCASAAKRSGVEIPSVACLGVSPTRILWIHWHRLSCSGRSGIVSRESFRLDWLNF